MSLPCQVRRMRGMPFLRRLVGTALLISLAFCSGCRHCAKRAEWRNNGECKYAKVIHAAEGVAACTPVSASFPLDSGESGADLALQASMLEEAHDPACVDLYFAAACQAWQHVAALGELPARSDLLCESKPYHACLAKLLMTAQRFHRLDPTSGLQVFYQNQSLTIPVELHGFAWKAEDFNELELVGDYKLGNGARSVRTDGIGVPLVVLRHRCEHEQFYRKIQPFAATAVLRTRCAVETVGHVAGPVQLANQELVLEFYNPASCTHLVGADRRWTLAGDISAPLALTISLSPNSPVRAFVRPDSANARAQLVMVEPYQPGKIPVVFVHGLLSDPTTWITLGNGLRREPWFRERYQIWAFRYPSGMPFLVSAATMRRELNAAVAMSPGAAEDPAVQQMVIVGHSMGGLVAKLQVTESGADLWNLVANRPLDAIQAEVADRERLREVFFFAPLPFVKKVIFIGTPHRGSTLASRGVGRFGSLLVKSSADTDARHRRVVAQNPGVFAPWIKHRIPTSVDMLEPDNPLLTTMETFSFGPCVQLHSIIGVARNKHCTGPGDGIVSLTSATHPGVVSERLVDATHEELHDAATTLNEIQCILEQQLRDYDRQLESWSSEAPIQYSASRR
jgi:pimeloyl-ACP methyl ester carboxylesterase